MSVDRLYSAAAALSLELLMMIFPSPQSSSWSVWSVVLWLAGGAVGLAQAPEPPHHLIEVTIRDAGTLERLLAMDLDLASCAALELPARRVEVIATDADLHRIAAAGLHYTVAITNLEQHYATELAKYGPYPATLTPPLGQGAMGGHYTLTQVVANLDGFAQQYPTLCSTKVSIGQSIQGRDLWMVKISDNVGVDENEPEVLYDALHHAREPLSMETTLLFMDELLTNYGTDPEITYLVDNRELYFVPVVNPDGYEYNRQTNPNGGGMWRKNRRVNTGGTFGVDLNRNYATAFGGPGSSGSPSSSTYRGTSAFSEPESAALEAFAQARAFTLVMSTHTYTDVLLRPWGYQLGDPPNGADYARAGAVATSANGIQHGSAGVLLYLASGTALDHHHTTHGSLGWTAELGRSNEGGFWPNPTNTVAIANRHQHMFRMLALLAGMQLQDAQIVVMGSGLIGTGLRLGALGAVNARIAFAVSAGTANLPLPGVNGNLLLDPATLVVLPQIQVGASGYAAVDLTIPNDPGLIGQTLYWQALQVQPSALTLGNREQITFR